MPTILDRLRNKYFPPEARYFNPLDLRIKNRLTIDLPEYFGKTFTTAAIKEYKRKEGKIAGYELYSDDSPADRVDLLVFPSPSQNPPVEILLLTTFYATNQLGGIAWDKQGKELYESMTSSADPSTLMYKNDDGEIVWQFWRLFDRTAPYKADETLITDQNSDGILENSEIVITEVEIFDFHRNTIKDGVEVEEFLYVFYQKDSRYQEMLSGCKLLPENLMVLP